MDFIDRRYEIPVIANYDRCIFSFDPTVLGFWSISQMFCRIIAGQREYHVRDLLGCDRAGRIANPERLSPHRHVLLHKAAW
jgi:hypothetical protein